MGYIRIVGDSTIKSLGMGMLSQGLGRQPKWKMRSSPPAAAPVVPVVKKPDPVKAPVQFPKWKMRSSPPAVAPVVPVVKKPDPVKAPVQFPTRIVSSPETSRPPTVITAPITVAPKTPVGITPPSTNIIRAPVPTYMAPQKRGFAAMIARSKQIRHRNMINAENEKKKQSQATSQIIVSEKKISDLDTKQSVAQSDKRSAEINLVKSEKTINYFNTNPPQTIDEKAQQDMARKQNVEAKQDVKEAVKIINTSNQDIKKEEQKVAVAEKTIDQSEKKIEQYENNVQAAQVAIKQTEALIDKAKIESVTQPIIMNEAPQPTETIISDQDEYSDPSYKEAYSDEEFSDAEDEYSDPEFWNNYPMGSLGQEKKFPVGLIVAGIGIGLLLLTKK